MNYETMSIEQFRQEVLQRLTIQEIISAILGSEPSCKKAWKPRNAGNNRGECLAIEVPSVDAVKIINPVGQYVVIHWGTNRTEEDAL